MRSEAGNEERLWEPEEERTKNSDESDHERFIRERHSLPAYGFVPEILADAAGRHASIFYSRATSLGSLSFPNSRRTRCGDGYPLSARWCEFGRFNRSHALLMTRLITGSVVTALLCSSLNGCSRGDIMEAISISSVIAGAATVVTIVAVHEATERQRQVAQEQARFAQELIEQHRARGVKKSRYIAVATVREPDPKGLRA